MSTNRIAELNRMLEVNNVRNAQVREKITTELQTEYSAIFTRDKALEKALENLNSASEYTDEDGEIYRWFRWPGLDDIALEAREYFEAYVSDHACVTVNWERSCFQASEGESIIIQDDTRHGNGVWLNQKCIIDESEYRDEDGEVNEAKRNELIEAHMERSGYFPGVFRIDSHGNVSHVRTNKGVKS